MKPSINNQDVHHHVRQRVYLLAAVMMAVPVAGILWLARSESASAAAVAASPRHSTMMEQRTDHPFAARAVSSRAPVPTALEEKWGIKVSSISLTNGDSAVEVRYTVLAPEKTSLLTGANAEVYLIDQTSGTKLPMTTANPDHHTDSSAAPSRSVRNMMRLAGMFPPPSSRLMAGKMYSVKIPNWDSILTSGTTVAFVVGHERVDNLVVE